MYEEREYFKYVSVSKNLNATASYLWKRRNLIFFQMRSRSVWTFGRLTQLVEAYGTFLDVNAVKLLRIM